MFFFLLLIDDLVVGACSRRTVVKQTNRPSRARENAALIRIYLPYRLQLHNDLDEEEDARNSYLPLSTTDS